MKNRAGLTHTSMNAPDRQSILPIGGRKNKITSMYTGKARQRLLFLVQLFKLSMSH